MAMAKSVLEDLAKVDLLAGLGPTELAAVATRLRIRSFDPAELILAYHDRGHDVGFVLSGALEMWVGERHFHLNEGDSCSYSSGEPHRYRNSGPREAIVVWAISPPSF